MKCICVAPLSQGAEPGHGDQGVFIAVSFCLYHSSVLVFCKPCARQMVVWEALVIGRRSHGSSNYQKSPEPQASFCSCQGACLGMPLVPGTQGRQSSLRGLKQPCWALPPPEPTGLKFPNYFSVYCIIIRKIPAQDVILGVPNKTKGLEVLSMFLLKCK